MSLTLLHESARQALPNAPRVDLLGMQAISKTLRKSGRRPPRRAQLHRISLVGDLISNTLYYSAVGMGSPDSALVRGALLGAGAGVGAVALPKPMGLSRRYSARTPETRAMTIAWYLTGGLVAALAYRLLGR
jgi:hypothetical protein